MAVFRNISVFAALAGRLQRSAAALAILLAATGVAPAQTEHCQASAEQLVRLQPQFSMRFGVTSGDQLMALPMRGLVAFAGFVQASCTLSGQIGCQPLTPETRAQWLATLVTANLLYLCTSGDVAGYDAESANLIRQMEEAAPLPLRLAHTISAIRELGGTVSDDHLHMSVEIGGQNFEINLNIVGGNG